jgi:hypothetical protein
MKPASTANATATIQKPKAAKIKATTAGTITNGKPSLTIKVPSPSVAHRNHFECGKNTILLEPKSFGKHEKPGKHCRASRKPLRNC